MMAYWILKKKKELPVLFVERGIADFHSPDLPWFAQCCVFNASYHILNSNSTTAVYILTLKLMIV